MTVNRDAVDRLKARLEAISGNIKSAVAETARGVAEELKARGQQEIVGAALARGAQSWHVSVKQTGYIARITANLGGFWRVFATGKTIAGKPLLWIPLPGTDAVGVQAKDYGGLFLVNGAKPLLGSVADHQIKYVGVAQVQIRRRLAFGALGREAAAKARELFLSRLRLD